MDPWLSKGVILNEATNIIYPKSVQDYKLIDCVENDGDWNWRMLNILFPKK